MLYNKDYYTGMSDELATEFLGVREAHASFKELAEAIKERRAHIEELKKALPKKKAELAKAQATSKKAAKEAKEAGDKFVAGEIKPEEYNKIIEEAKSTSKRADDLAASISKLEKDRRELEAEEAAWLKKEEKLSTKQRRAIKKALAAATKEEEPEPDEDAHEASKGEWDDLKKDRKTDEELAKELDDLFAEDSEDNPAVKEKDPEFQAAMDKFLKAMEEDDDEDETDEDDSDAKNADEDETGDSSDSSDDTKPVVKTVVFAKKESKRMKMNDLAFYNGIGNDAFEYDRDKGMSDSLRGWIESTLEDDAKLAEDSILNHLGPILKKNPNLIDAVKDAIVKAEEYNMPYEVKFVSKVTGETFDKKADAEASIEAFIKAGATTFDSVFEVKYMANKAFVDPDEVEEYIQNFDGNKEELRKKLYKPAEKAAKPGKGKAAKA